MTGKAVTRVIARTYDEPPALVAALNDRLGDVGSVAEQGNAQA